jgi:alkylated DNA repair dioxygenase AlkB
MQQQELFEIGTPQIRGIPGFLLKENYITPAEEFELLLHIDTGPWQNDYRRRIQQYGLGYGAERGGTPVWVRDFPDWLARLGERVACDAGFDRSPENCVINEYIPPQGIAPHKDYPAFGPTIACVSLGSDVLLDLIHSERSERVSIHVPARSFWVMTDEARSDWQHGIAPRLTDLIRGERRKRAGRVSITFRTAKLQGSI